MTEEQPNKEIISRDNLYDALYKPLNGQNIDTIRTKTLQALLGTSNDDELQKKIEDYNKIQVARQNLGKDAIIFPTTLDVIAEYWTALHDLYVCYLEKLKDHKGINKILIYEAPPPPNTNRRINYILAESCDDCKKSCKALKECECPKSCKKWDEHKKRFVKNPSGAYYKTIKSLNDGTEERTVKEILVEQGILFIDLCPLPLPMTTDIRRKVWGGNFEPIDDKPRSVVLLELALKFAKAQGVEISKTPTIAMGTPTATSQSIYLYFEKKKRSSSCFKNLNILKFDNGDIDFSELLKTNEKYVKKGQILPLYKSNIIAGSNTPNADLLKRIFK